MENERINGQYKDANDLYEYLMHNSEVSFAIGVKDAYRKILLLSVASLFENQISKIILSYASSISGDDKRIVKLIESKVIERQYHTLFNWDAKNSNSFWGLYGEDTKNKVRSEIDKNTDLKTAEENFLDLGKRRNLLVHKNFSEHDVNITLEEIYEKYKSACLFVDYISSVLSKN